MTRNEAQSFIDAFVKLRESATDEQACAAAAVYPTLKGTGELIAAGTRINHNGIIKRAAADLWDTAENSPANAPGLWEEIALQGGYRIIPETITAGLAFALGERGWWKDVLYESLMEANVYTPEQYPAGWKEVADAA